MNSSKGVIWAAVLIVVAFGAFALYKSQQTPADTGTIKIGLIAPLTGSVAALGEAGKNGAELAMDVVQSDTSLKHSYELIVEDDAFDPAKTASAYQKLVNVDKVDMIISVGSGPGNVVAPLAQKDGIPHIGLASDATVAKGDYNFIHWTQPAQETAALIAELKKRGLTKVAIIGVNHQGWNAIIDDFNKKIAGTGITVVDTEIFNSGTTDFRTLIAKAQKANPDVYYLGAFDPEVVTLGKQFKELGVKQPVTSVESFGLTADPAVFEGDWYIDSAVPTSGFSDMYKKKYNASVGPTASNVYDAVNLFVLAAERARDTSHRAVAVTLAGINDYSGAFGPLTMGADGVIESQASVKIIKGGKPVSLGQ